MSMLLQGSHGSTHAARPRSVAAALLIAASQLGCSGSDPPIGVGDGGRASNGGGTSSGSAGSGTAGQGGLTIVVPPSGGAGTAGAPSCGVQAFDRERKPAEVLLVLDRSGSMENELEGSMQTRWDAVIPTITSAIEATSMGIWWGLKTYPELEQTEGCAPESIVPTIHVPIAEGNAPAVVSAIRATTPKGDGTPTGDAIKFGLAHLRERAASSANPKFILLATDGEPTCPNDQGLEFAVSQITAALWEGIPTFVLGVDTTKDSAVENLNAMAQAGGRPRPPDSTGPNGEPTSFYLASTEAQLGAALQAITGEIASCVFDLDPPPPDPTNIAVDFNGVRTDRDPARLNGWEYTEDDHTQLQVYGEWCDRIKAESKNQVNIKYGCPDVPIPAPR